MTLRTMAKILGISPAYLSLLVNGKRKWRGELKERYEALVNTEETAYETGAKRETNSMPNPIGMVGGTRVELVTSAMSTQRSKPLS